MGTVDDDDDVMPDCIVTVSSQLLSEDIPKGDESSNNTGNTPATLRCASAGFRQKSYCVRSCGCAQIGTRVDLFQLW